jgi:predicted ferric reductase
MLPALIPLLTGASSGLDYEAFSHISRASAFAAYALVWMSMLAGLSITGKVGRKRPGMQSRFGLHRFTSLLGLGFALVHALTILSDKYMAFTLGQLFVPFMGGNYKSQWLGLGQVAIYMFAVIALSFYVRNRLGVRAWRLIHSLSFALFLMSLIHGLQSGSDSGNWWASGLYWLSAASVLLGSVYRVLAARAGRSRERIAGTGLVVTGGKAQVRPTQRGHLVTNRVGGQPMQPVAVPVLAFKSKEHGNSHSRSALITQN